MSIKQPTPAQFLADNLEMLGFGNNESAIIQTVKELFENALDAVDDDGMIVVRLEPGNDCIQVICTDTGHYPLKNNQLCGSVFASTKVNGQCGKFGVGLKAALLYSQQHLPKQSGLQITSTLDSHEIHVIKLHMNPQDNTIHQTKKKFAISDVHKAFSGTEVRLCLPLPLLDELSGALRVLHHYLTSFTYVMSSTLSIEFQSNLAIPLHVFHPKSSFDPFDRFVAAMNCSQDQIIHVMKDFDNFSVNILAYLAPLKESSAQTEINIELHRYSNNVPLIATNSMFSCAIVQAVQGTWKRFGYKCLAQLPTLSTPLCATRVEIDNARRWQLVLAINLSTRAQIKYHTLTKTSFDNCYQRGIAATFEQTLFQLQQFHPRLFTSPNELKHERIFTQYMPLIAKAVRSIASSTNEIDINHFNANGLLFGLQSMDEFETRISKQMQMIFEKETLI
ncbi:hypothetical protein THRCLA_00422 [Thraustotheca clavata]|uniref:Histidine kinase/HSP90-like ATPase domain-containing protein n=1 Tax=Thraustotheca clavata TaxID=74557 RepID=A0A1W0AC34_9STRA|nr:hypothetical protein THRCLA_00422 [Thraustotheca clavata]